MFFFVMVIALLTDFGTRDYFVGALKGVIFSINPSAKIVDITHEIPAQDVKAASFTLRACFANFPKKTIFVTVVDPGVGSNRKALLVETADYYFIAPDNGLLSFVFDEAAHYTVYQLTAERFFAEKVSRTFHGRDIFAPVAAHLSNGVEPHEFGAEISNFVHLPNSTPTQISEREIEAEIIHIDFFGNLVTNLKSTDLPAEFTLRIKEETINKRQNYFAEAEKSELFTILGSAGFLEIVAFRDSVKDILRVEVGERIRLLTTYYFQSPKEEKSV
ncbi:MAG: SAM-dependent chlorinase/fluorinase [Pyrinomonadaceae bacterium]|nr:SAM-dependent chlorinase/fluorinase [Pyrinomonadaceae bacterium]